MTALPAIPYNTLVVASGMAAVGFAAGLKRGHLIRGLDRTADHRAEQVALPGKCRTPALARDLGYRATEVQIDVIGTILVDDDSCRSSHNVWINAVQLDRTRILILGEGNHVHRGGVALHKRA